MSIFKLARWFPLLIVAAVAVRVLHYRTMLGNQDREVLRTTRKPRAVSKAASHGWDSTVTKTKVHTTSMQFTTASLPDVNMGTRVNELKAVDKHDLITTTAAAEPGEKNSPARSGGMCQDIAFVKTMKCGSSSLRWLLQSKIDRCSRTEKVELFSMERPLSKLKAAIVEKRKRKGPLFWISVVREPVSRQISHFHQCRFEKGKWCRDGPEKYFRPENSDTNNLQARFLGWQEGNTTSASDLVANFDFIVVRERFHESLCMLQDKGFFTVRDLLYFSFKERKNPEVYISDSAKQMATELAWMDKQLYDEVLTEFSQAAERIPCLSHKVRAYEELLEQGRRSCEHTYTTPVTKESRILTDSCFDDFCTGQKMCASNRLPC